MVGFESDNFGEGSARTVRVIGECRSVVNSGRGVDQDCASHREGGLDEVGLAGRQEEIAATNGHSFACQGSVATRALESHCQLGRGHGLLVGAGIMCCISSIPCHARTAFSEN